MKLPVDPRLLVRMPARAGASAAISGALAAGLAIEERVRAVDDARRDVYVQAWARGILRSLRVELVVEGAPAKADRPHLAVANHRSTVDIFLMLHLFGGHLLARGDMAGWPVVGTLAKMAGTLFVDRSDAASGAAAVRRVKDRLEKGRTIGVFPEGTTFHGDEVRPFHAGAFMAITRVRGEVTPVGVAYEDPSLHYVDEPIGEHFRKLLAAERTRVAVVVGEKIPAAGHTISALRDRAQEEVQRLVHRARTLV